jgi:hypothetical protein
VSESAQLVAPLGWRRNPQWFEDVSEDIRLEVVREHCSRIFTHFGQACVVISYPRSGGRVAFYDIDGASIGIVSLDDVRAGRDEDCREVEEQDFSFSIVVDSAYANEASNIFNLINEGWLQ